MAEKKYTYDEVYESSLKYFNDDELAATTWIKKYCLKNNDGTYSELNPDDMHQRMAREFAIVEGDYEYSINDDLRLKLSEYGYNRKSLKEDDIFNLFKDFKYIIPGGSVMAGLANPSPVSLSNCWVVDGPSDSIDDIFRVCNEQSQLMKRRGGCVESNTSVIVKNKGVIKIKDIEIGDEVLSFNIINKKDEWKQVLDKYYTEVSIDDQIEVTTQRGVKLKTSKKHPLLCMDKEKGYVYENFNSGKLTNSTNKQPNMNNILTINPDEFLRSVGWLIGCHMGDGTSEYRNYKKYSKSRTRILGDNENVIREYSNIYNILSGSDAKYSLVNNKKYKTNVWEYSCVKDSNIEIFDKYFDNQIGKKTYTWDIPKFVYSNDLMIPFIAGLIDSDGYITNSGRIDISICSENAINSICKYLSSNGQYFTCAKKTSKRKNEKPIYTLRIHSNNEIYPLILNFIKHDLKNDKMISASNAHQSLSFNLTYDEIKYIHEYDYKQYIKIDIKKYQLLKHNALNTLKSGKIAVSALLLLKNNNIITNKLYEEILSRDNIITCKEDNVIKNEYIDISVEGNNNYYAGEFGFINIHNCGFDISKLRPYGANVNNSAKTSTGAVSFMDLFSHVTNTIAQSGRRGALMLSISIKHPDAKEFIEKKQDLSKVTGANISVQIDDEFMESVISANDLYLQKFPIDASNNDLFGDNEISAYDINVLHNGVKENTYFKIIHAKELWDNIIHCAWSTAEPGIIFQTNHYEYSPDGVYPSFRGSCTNPCVIGDTTLLTKNGFVKIKDLVDCEIEIWNGKEWTIVTPFKTSDSEKVYKVNLSDGSELICTNYHKFILKDNIRKELKDCIVGDKLEKFSYPIIGEYNNGDNDKTFYTYGFYCGDGTSSKLVNGTNYFIDLYGVKKHLIENLNVIKYGNEDLLNDKQRTKIDIDNVSLFKNYVPNVNDSINERLSYIAGLIDSDGTLNDKGGSIAISSNDKEFLLNVKKMLITLGIRSVVSLSKEETYKIIKDGLYFTQKSYRLIISASNIVILKNIGLKTNRVPLLGVANRDASRFIQITNIEYYGEEATFCVNDPLNHSALFNDIMTAQCGEIFMHEDSCRLIHINLTSFIDNPFTENASLNEEKLYEISYEAMRLGDNLVDLEVKAIEKILTKIEKDGDKDNNEYKLYKRLLKHTLEGRRCGLGFTGIADMMAMLGFKYDSETSLSMVNHAMNIMFIAEMDSQVDMAITRGSFPSFDRNVELEGNTWYDFLKNDYNSTYQKMIKYGRRNISFNTVAPTGTVSLMAKCSSGIEPIFLPFYKRRRKCMANDDKVDFTDQNGEKYTEFVVVHPTFKKWAETFFNELSKETFDEWKEVDWNAAYKLSPWFGSTANDINWEKRVELQSIIQKYITHSISSTINLPNDVSEKEVSNIYIKSWESKLKGITCYRDGCRSGVLVSTDKNKSENDDKVCITNKPANKRPKEVPCKIFRFNNKGEKWIGVVGMVDNKPYEIFTGILEKLNIPNWVEDGVIIRNKEKRTIEGEEKLVSRYDICYIDKEGYRTCVEGLSRTFNPEYWNYAKLISGLLRHRMPLPYLIKIISSLNLDASNINTWKNGVIRTLRKLNEYNNDEMAHEICPECSGRLLNEGGCMKCLDCGYSKCG